MKDVNDNPPVFERPTYRTQITEEDDRNLPKRVLQVSLQIIVCIVVVVFLHPCSLIPVYNSNVFAVMPELSLMTEYVNENELVYHAYAIR